MDFGSLGGLGGGGGDLVAARSSAETSFNYGGQAVPEWVWMTGLAVVGLFAFVGLLLIVKKL